MGSHSRTNRGSIRIPSKRKCLIKPEMMHEWLQRSNVVFKGGGLDESPHCYKRLDEVLTAQGNTIRILHMLTPVGVATAGADELIPTRTESEAEVRNTNARAKARAFLYQAVTVRSRFVNRACGVEALTLRGHSMVKVVPLPGSD